MVKEGIEYQRNGLPASHGEAVHPDITVAPASQRRARWTTMKFDRNAFFTAVEEAIELFSRAPMSLGDRVHRFNSVLLAAAKIHVMNV